MFDSASAATGQGSWTKLDGHWGVFNSLPPSCSVPGGGVYGERDMLSWLVQIATNRHWPDGFVDDRV